MIVIHRFSVSFCCRQVDFVGVHNGGYNVFFTVFRYCKTVGFGVEFLCKFISAVFFKVNSIDVKHHFVKYGCVGSKSSA